MTFPVVLRSHILEKYVAREFLKLMGLSLVTFVSLFIVVDFFEKIDRLVRAQLGPGALLEYLILKLPFAIGQVLPAAVLLGVMLTFGLMSRSHETMAIRTSGLNILSLIRPTLIYSGVVALLLLALNLYLIPWSQGRLDVFWQTQVNKKAPRNLHNLEHFWYKGDQAIYNIVMFRKDIQTLEGVKIYLFDRQFHLVQIIAAARAQWQGDHWRFFEGYVQFFAPGTGAVTGSTSSNSGTWCSRNTPRTSPTWKRKSRKWMSMNSIDYTVRLERDGYKSTPYRVDLYSRFSLALTPLVLVMLGLGLALRHEQIYLTSMVAVGLGLMFVYWLFFGFCASFGQAGSIPVLVAVIFPHLVFGLVALRMLRQVTR